jgi:hypothetical protein
MHRRRLMTAACAGTALIPACHCGHVETVRELLKTKIDIGHVNNLGWTALLEAVIGVAPLEHARQRNYRAIVEILQRRPG